MSLTYAEIYQNKLKYKNQISDDNKENNSGNQKIISLIKKFPLKQRKTFKTDKNIKPKRIQSKSVDLIHKYRKANNKKKTMSKQKMENNRKNKSIEKGHKKNKNKKNNIKKNNELEVNNFYKTEISKDHFTNKKEGLKNKNKLFPGLSKTHNNNKNNKNNKKENLQKNNNDEFEINVFNKINRFGNINKSKNIDSFETYFDIFRLRQNSANFKNKIKNIYFNKYNSNNDLYYKFFNTNETNKNNRHQNVKSYSDYSQKRSKTYYKAIKLKEQLEYNFKNNNINKHMYSSCTNFYVKNNIKIKNDKDEKDKNKNLIKEMNHHFFEEKDKRPKVMKKFLTQNGTLNYDDINKERRNKNNSRTKTFGFFVQNNENGKEEDNNMNNLINKFSSELYRAKFKSKVNFNNKSLNLIVQDNPKLNNLLKKIPSNRENKDKSLDLINYILKLRNKGDSIKNLTYIKYNSDINLRIYPANDWEPIPKLKSQI